MRVNLEINIKAVLVVETMEVDCEVTVLGDPSGPPELVKLLSLDAVAKSFAALSEAVYEEQAQ